MHHYFRKGISLLAAAAVSFLPAAPAFADVGDGHHGKPGRVTSVASANPKAVGAPAPNILSPELIETIVAQGSFKLENPGEQSFYGYGNDGPPVPVPGDLPSSSHKDRAGQEYLPGAAPPKRRRSQLRLWNSFSFPGPRERSRRPRQDYSHQSRRGWGTSR